MAQPEARTPDASAEVPAGVAALLDAAGPALLADGDGTIVYANAALLALTGHPSAGLVGRPVEVLAAERGRGLPADGSDALALRADGSTFWARLHRAPVAGTALSLGQVADVTARREAEDALALSRQREALGLLTNSVAHEFNNFLQIMIGYVDGLRRRLGTSEDPFIQRAMTRSADATERAAILTRQLLAYSRRIVPDVRPVDLDALLKEVAARLGPGLPPGVTLTVTGTPGLPPALANPAQVELALGYVVANAREAMAEGGTLALSTYRVEPGDRSLQRPEDGMVGIRVRDTGIGMEPDLLARALAPFAAGREGGRGAGLAIVHGLMKRQNGTIGLDSRPGEGTEVRLAFPAVPAPSDGTAETSELSFGAD